MFISYSHQITSLYNKFNHKLSFKVSSVVIRSSPPGFCQIMNAHLKVMLLWVITLFQLIGYDRTLKIKTLPYDEMCRDYVQVDNFHYSHRLNQLEWGLMYALKLQDLFHIVKACYHGLFSDNISNAWKGCL